MRDGLSGEQWAATRALLEGAAPTHARVAACLGVHATTVSTRAAEGAWLCLDFRSPQVRAAHAHLVELAARRRNGETLPPVGTRPAGRGEVQADGGADLGVAPSPAGAAALPALPLGERVERLRAMLAGRMEEVLLGAEAGRPIEARQVAAFNALAQVIERTAATAPDAAAAQVKSDEELAEILGRIDDRIVELAAARVEYLLVKLGRMNEAEAKAAVWGDAVA